MSNPWAKSFEELRSPYLQEKMAKKDYDGDGKVESGKDEYFGSRDKAIKKAMGKKVDDKKKVSEHHTKDKDGNTIPHGDGSPSSVEEMKKFGPGGDPVKKPDFLNKALDKLKKNTPVKKLDKAHYEPEAEVIEAKVDTVDPKNKRKRRNEVSFGKQTKPYDPPGKAYKNEMGKFLQKQRKQKHDKNRGVKTKGMGEEVVLEADKKGKGSGTKDACYKKVKASASVWPSAYASGRLVQCRKKGAANYGNSKKEEFDFRIKSFDELVGECWKTHKQQGMKKKGNRMVPNCVPKNEEIKITPHDISGGTKAGTDFMSGRKNPKTGKPVYKLSNPGGMKLKLAHYDWKFDLDFVDEALKGKKLDIDDSGKVNNKIEINPEVKSEEAKAPVKK